MLELPIEARTNGARSAARRIRVESLEASERRTVPILRRDGVSLVSPKEPTLRERPIVAGLSIEPAIGRDPLAPDLPVETIGARCPFLVARRVREMILSREEVGPAI